jgi:hypothetical protein
MVEATSLMLAGAGKLLLIPTQFPVNPNAVHDNMARSTKVLRIKINFKLLNAFET